MSFTKSDITILGKLNDANLDNEMKSATINGISTLTKLSKPKIRQSVSLLINNNLLSQGFKQKNANTYYINEEGITFLKNLGLINKE